MRIVLLLLLVACSKGVSVKKDAAQSCVARYHVAQGGGLEVGTSVRAVDTDSTKMSPAGMVELSPDLRMVPIAAVENFHAVLWQRRDEKDIVVSRDYASDLDVVDLPRLAKGRETRVMGKLTPQGMASLGRREIVELLLASGIARAFWHTDAALCLLSEESTAAGYKAHFHAEHNYYTNEHVSPEYRFTLEVASDGTVSAIGDWHED